MYWKDPPHCSMAVMQWEEWLMLFRRLFLLIIVYSEMSHCWVNQSMEPSEDHWCWESGRMPGTPIFVIRNNISVTIVFRRILLSTWHKEFPYMGVNSRIQQALNAISDFLPNINEEPIKRIMLWVMYIKRRDSFRGHMAYPMRHVWKMMETAVILNCHSVKWITWKWPPTSNMHGRNWSCQAI